MGITVMFTDQQNRNFHGLRACYGVDLDGNDLIVARGERSRGRISHSIVAPTDPAFKAAISGGAACIGCLSAKESFTRWLEAPFAAAGKALKVFPTLLDVELPFPLEDCIYCFSDMRRTGSGTTRALAVVARRQDIERKIAALNEKNVDPVMLDQEGLALWTQSLREAPVAAAESGLLRVIIHLGGDHVSVVIGRGTEFINAHGMLSRDAGQIGRLMREAQLVPFIYDDFTPKEFFVQNFRTRPNPWCGRNYFPGCSGRISGLLPRTIAFR